MMLVPRKNDFDLFDDVFQDAFFGRGENKIMKTDVKEHDDSYELIIDLPGFEKENINISMEDDYLTIHAKTDSKKEEQEKGKYVRKERYSGEFSRSYYVGDDVTDENIKASFKNGVLNVILPKKQIKKETEKKYIDIDD